MRSFRLFLGLSLALASARPLAAALPQTLNYQGRVRLSGGAPVPDSPGNTVVFRICANATCTGGGDPLWTETWNGGTATVDTKSGLFNVILGSFNPLTLPFDQQYYLEINFNGDGPMTPRQPLTMAPYAFNAQSASGLSLPLSSSQNSASTLFSIVDSATSGGGAIKGQGNTGIWGVGSGVNGVGVLADQGSGSLGLKVLGGLSVTGASTFDTVVSLNGGANMPFGANFSGGTFNFAGSTIANFPSQPVNAPFSITSSAGGAIVNLFNNAASNGRGLVAKAASPLGVGVSAEGNAYGLSATSAAVAGLFQGGSVGLSSVASAANSVGVYAASTDPAFGIGLQAENASAQPAVTASNFGSGRGLSAGSANAEAVYGVGRTGVAGVSMANGVGVLASNGGNATSQALKVQGASFFSGGSVTFNAHVDFSGATITGWSLGVNPPLVLSASNAQTLLSVTNTGSGASARFYANNGDAVSAEALLGNGFIGKASGNGAYAGLYGDAGSNAHWGVQGVIANSAQYAGVYGSSGATIPATPASVGVVGASNFSGSSGVWGEEQAGGGGAGVVGKGQNIGVSGSAAVTGGYGVVGIQSVGTTGAGILGSAAGSNAIGVSGVASGTNGRGVFGMATGGGLTSAGVYGRSNQTNGKAMIAEGVGTGLSATASGAAGRAIVAAVNSSAAGIDATNNGGGNAISGISAAGTGVYAQSGGTAPAAAVFAVNSSTGPAVYANSTSGLGVNAVATNAQGVYAQSTNSQGVYGASNNSEGVRGEGITGVYAKASSSAGVALVANFGTAGSMALKVSGPAYFDMGSVTFNGHVDFSGATVTGWNFASNIVAPLTITSGAAFPNPTLLLTNTGTGYGVIATTNAPGNFTGSNPSFGSTFTAGVYGFSNRSISAGVVGRNTEGSGQNAGVMGASLNGIGLLGLSDGATQNARGGMFQAVLATGAYAYGVTGLAAESDDVNGVAVYARAKSFNDRGLRVEGSSEFTATSTGPAYAVKVTQTSNLTGSGGLAAFSYASGAAAVAGYNYDGTPPSQGSIPGIGVLGQGAVGVVGITSNGAGVGVIGNAQGGPGSVGVQAENNGTGTALNANANNGTAIYAQGITGIAATANQAGGVGMYLYATPGAQALRSYGSAIFASNGVPSSVSFMTHVDFSGAVVTGLGSGGVSNTSSSNTPAGFLYNNSFGKALEAYANNGTAVYASAPNSGYAFDGLGKLRLLGTDTSTALIDARVYPSGGGTYYGSTVSMTQTANFSGLEGSYYYIQSLGSGSSATGYDVDIYSLDNNARGLRTNVSSGSGIAYGADLFASGGAGSFGLHAVAGNANTTALHGQNTFGGLGLRVDGPSSLFGSLDLNSSYIHNVVDPAASSDAATKNYVDTQLLGLSGSYVPKAGGNMTGTLSLNASGIYSVDAVNSTAGSIAVHGKDVSSGGWGLWGEGDGVGASGETSNSGGFGMLAKNSATSGSPVALYAQTTGGAPNPAGVVGNVTGSGFSVIPGGAGLLGFHNNTGTGQGAGVYGETQANAAAGVWGQANTAGSPGVKGTNSAASGGVGVLGEAGNAAGYGVWASNQTGGVALMASSTGKALVATGAVTGLSATVSGSTGNAVYAWANSTADALMAFQVGGNPTTAAVFGQNGNGGYGVHGKSSAAGGIGLLGEGELVGVSVTATDSSGIAVFGNAIGAGSTGASLKGQTGAVVTGNSLGLSVSASTANSVALAAIDAYTGTGASTGVYAKASTYTAIALLADNGATMGAAGTGAAIAISGAVRVMSAVYSSAWTGPSFNVTTTGPAGRVRNTGSCVSVSGITVNNPLVTADSIIVVNWSNGGFADKFVMSPVRALSGSFDFYFYDYSAASFPGQKSICNGEGFNYMIINP